MKSLLQQRKKELRNMEKINSTTNSTTKITKKIQTALILETLKNGESISPMDALNRFGCFRLGARIYELRHGKHDGIFYDIEDIPHKGKQYAVYRLVHCLN